MLLLLIVKFVYYQIIYIINDKNLFKIIYKYNLILKLYLKNKIIEEIIFIVKERVKEVNLIK